MAHFDVHTLSLLCSGSPLPPLLLEYKVDEFEVVLLRASRL